MAASYHHGIAAPSGWHDDCILSSDGRSVGQTQGIAMKAVVTATHDDGAQWGWPGERVIRYEDENGCWAWVPGGELVGQEIEL